MIPEFKISHSLTRHRYSRIVFFAGLCLPSLLTSSLSFSQESLPQCTSCDSFAHDSFQYDACLLNEGFLFPGIEIISQTVGAEFIENDARKDWLILGDGRDGAVTTDELDVRDGQVFSGILHNGSRPVIKHADGNHRHRLIDTFDAPSFTLRNFYLDGAGTNSSFGTLLAVSSPQNLVIHNTIFSPSLHQGIKVINWGGKPLHWKSYQLSGHRSVHNEHHL